MTEIKVNLISSDGRVFTIDKEVGMLSELLRDRLEYVDENDNENISLPNVSGNTLEKVIEYCEHHRNDRTDENELDEIRCIKGWDQEYVERFTSHQDLFDTVLAADYLDIKPLLNLTCNYIASMIRGKKLEEIKVIFNIENSFTPEEEEQIRREKEWASEC
ncbi:E3 ubiquitin ligase [Neocallimastix californiae]|uniref:E3 ubiquitin ligase complex SCF subunit n=1 Tax=Neocallimastix californiae TaxID=1754190 RepID=A0A1Y2DSD2_9FUNG|nr:E3 ubiquitin ligase [Neocallimastix californiae]|eukprot:ORY62036.1 E3 ubiquitin ligase [Neocallimastix californiae]